MTLAIIAVFLLRRRKARKRVAYLREVHAGAGTRPNVPSQSLYTQGPPSTTDLRPLPALPPSSIGNSADDVHSEVELQMMSRIPATGSPTVPSPLPSQVTSSTNRRASVLDDLLRLNVPSEVIVQVLENIRDDGDVGEGRSRLDPRASNGLLPSLPRGAASPAPPGYDFKG